MMSEASLFMKVMSASMGFLPVRSAGWQPAVTCGLDRATLVPSEATSIPSKLVIIPIRCPLCTCLRHLPVSFMLLVCALSEQLSASVYM
jgi:hypothetical protein